VARWPADQNFNTALHNPSEIGPKPQWLLIKRRDERARPGSDIVAECPRSVLSGRTLDESLE